MSQGETFRNRKKIHLQPAEINIICLNVLSPNSSSSGNNHIINNNNNNSNHNCSNNNNNSNHISNSSTNNNNNSYGNFGSNNNLKPFLNLWSESSPTNELINSSGGHLGGNHKTNISEETYEVGIAKDIRALELRLESELDSEEHEKPWSHVDTSIMQK